MTATPAHSTATATTAAAAGSAATAVPARSSMLAVLDRARRPADGHDLRALREELAEWYVIACGVEDLVAAVRAFEVRFILFVGGAQLVADSFAELERACYAPERFAVVPDATRARRAIGAPDAPGAGAGAPPTGRLAGPGQHPRAGGWRRSALGAAQLQ